MTIMWKYLDACKYRGCISILGSSFHERSFWFHVEFAFRQSEKLHLCFYHNFHFSFSDSHLDYAHKNIPIFQIQDEEANSEKKSSIYWESSVQKHSTNRSQLSMHNNCLLLLLFIAVVPVFLLFCFVFIYLSMHTFSYCFAVYELYEVWKRNLENKLINGIVCGANNTIYCLELWLWLCVCLCVRARFQTDWSLIQCNVIQLLFLFTAFVYCNIPFI